MEIGNWKVEIGMAPVGHRENCYFRSVTIQYGDSKIVNIERYLLQTQKLSI